MTGLVGSKAFGALSAALTAATEFPPCAEAPYERLRGVVQSGSPLDRAVLLRHALRYREAQLGAGGIATLVVPDGPTWPGDDALRACGLHVDRRTSGSRTVRAFPWSPAWLLGSEDHAVDAAACSGIERRAIERVPGDPMLRLVGLQDYRSLGQRAAVRAALTAPVGSTLVVNLPTGEGKSLLFQAIDAIGYADDVGPGVTFVIVPTVPLAYDHERGLRERGRQDRELSERGLWQHDMAYVGGRDAANEGIASRVAAGTQGLVFAAPEALSTGRLARAAEDAARQGLLRALVIDEAHLVDGWGADFRPAFQALSGIRRSWAALAPANRPPRTLLLTATLTRRSSASLKALFEGPGPFGVVSGAQLRAEIDYWVADTCGRDERDRRVLEALHHLPRPLILYVTQVADAKDWYGRLLRLGFDRLRCVHGGTSPEDRAETVMSWASGAVDLVVATSSFGLGIDNAHVRAVVHACVPETLDRFYQEVGRGGRDGCASVSLLLPAQGDVGVARSINRRRLITVEKGYRRWLSMFRHPDRIWHGPEEYTLRLDVPPAVDERHIDMVSERSTDWSAKTLTLMAGAGLIEFVGPASRVLGSEDDVAAERAPGVYQRVRILDPSHAERRTWDDLIQAFRAAGHDADKANLRAMIAFLRSDRCPGSILVPLYEIPADEPCGPVRVANQCGTCSLCRRRPEARRDAQAWEPAQPWHGVAALGEAAEELVGTGNRLVVFYPQPGQRSFRRRLQRTVSRLVALGFRNVVAPREADLDWAEILRSPHRGPLFRAERPTPNRLPRGATVYFVPPGRTVDAVGLRPQREPSEANAARIYFLSDEAQHPDFGGRRWKDVYAGNATEFDALWARLHR